MSTKYNPYNFIPFGKLANHSEVEATKTALKNNHMSHDAFSNLSGKIKCDISALTPIINGSELIDKTVSTEQASISYREVKPYMRNDLAAIAANSIRGMIGANIETLSLSGPRVLDDKKMTYRQSAKLRDYAYGVILPAKEAHSELEIQPLGLPPFKLNYEKKVAKKWQAIFVDEQNQVLTLEQITPIILDKETRIKASWWDKSTGEFKGEQNVLRKADSTDDVLCSDTIKADHPWIRKIKQGDQLKSEGEVNFKGEPSLIRNLDVSSHFNKRVQKVAFPIANINAKKLPLSQTVIDDYLVLLNSSDKLKKAKQQKQSGSKFQFTNEDLYGQIVFFDVKNDHVCLLADSLIWRDKIQDSVANFFTPGQLPYNAQRTHLSVAETMLGTVVDEDKDHQHQSNKVSAFASRIRFYDAIADNADNTFLNTLFLLPRLDSPKLPCPSMYFHHKGHANDALIEKSKLNASQHALNGRKVYLRHDPNSVSATEISVLDLKQSDEVLSPLVMPKTKFEFEIEFNNLTADELHLLLTAIEPDKNYTHQIGMAKPYGYGQIKLDLKSIKLVNKRQRYMSFTNSGEVANWQAEQQDIDWLSWLNTHTQLTSINPLIDEETFSLLKQVGNFNNYTEHEIGYPMNSEFSPTIFGWFVNNDNPRQRDKQTLPRLNQGQFGELRENRR